MNGLYKNRLSDVKHLKHHLKISQARMKEKFNRREYRGVRRFSDYINKY